MITTGFNIVIVSSFMLLCFSGLYLHRPKDKCYGCSWSVHISSSGQILHNESRIFSLSFFSASVYLRLCLAFEGVTQRSIRIQEKIYCHCPPTWQHRLGGLENEETGKPARLFYALLWCDAVCCDRSVPPKRLYLSSRLHGLTSKNIVV